MKGKLEGVNEKKKDCRATFGTWMQKAHFQFSVKRPRAALQVPCCCCFFVCVCLLIQIATVLSSKHTITNSQFPRASQCLFSHVFFVVVCFLFFVFLNGNYRYQNFPLSRALPAGQIPRMRLCYFGGPSTLARQSVCCVFFLFVCPR